jgi:hypothetical protein
MAVIDEEMKKSALNLGIAAISLKLTELEKKAIAIIPVPTSKVRENGFGGYSKFMPQLTREQNNSIYGSLSDKSELERLCNGRHNAFQIKQLLDTQSSRESDLQAIIDYIEILRTANLVTLASVKK